MIRHKESTKKQKVLAGVAFVLIGIAVEYNTNLTWRNRDILMAATYNSETGYGTKEKMEWLNDFQTRITIRAKHSVLFRDLDRVSQDYHEEVNRGLSYIAQAAITTIDRHIYDGMEQNLPFPTGNIVLVVYVSDNPDNGLYGTRLTQYDSDGRPTGYFWHFKNLLTGESTEQFISLG